MPHTCVVGGCSNKTEDGFTMHKFPNDEATKRLWTKFVQTTRSDFLQPSGASVVCSAHFTVDCYDPSILMREQLGFKTKKKILPGKYPTVKLAQSHTAEESTSSTISQVSASAHTVQDPRPSPVPGPTTSTNTTTSTTTTVSTTTTATSTITTTISRPTTSTRYSTAKPRTMRPISSPSTSSSRSDQPMPAKRQRFTERREKEMMIHELIEGLTSEDSGEPQDDAMVPELADQEGAVRQHWTRACQTELIMVPSKVSKRSKRTQCYPRLLNKETQTQDNPMNPLPPRLMQDAEVQCLLDPHTAPATTGGHSPDLSASVHQAPQRDEGGADDQGDKDYVPSDDNSSTDSGQESNTTDEMKVWEEEKFLVFRSSLMGLFTTCLHCHHIAHAKISNVVGTMVSIEQKCISCSWKRVWNSQPLIKDTPAGNILLSAAILYAGASPTKTIRVLNHMGCKTHHLRTYFLHQKMYLMPTVAEVWKNKQHLLISDLIRGDQPLILGGDARADSPGHSAKFSSYTLMELNTSKIINIELIQKNEVTSSNAMELEGFKRSMTWMLETAMAASLDVECLITDRHLQVAKWIRENLTQYGIKHFFDVWHIAKSLKKKITAISKRKGCESLNKWTKSVINHLHWSASSTPDGNPDLMLEKFVSIINHIRDVHTHDGPLFPSCAHPPLVGERPREWLQPGTEPCERLSDLCTATRLKNDVKKMSPKKQTSRIEAFHALLNFFAPKLTVFSYEGMSARLLLAGLHYNENCNRDAATTSTGDIIFQIDFPRAKLGDYTLREKPTAASFGYVDDLMEATIRFVEDGAIPGDIKVIPPPLTSGFTKPTLEEALQRQKSRFASQKSPPEEAATATSSK